MCTQNMRALSYIRAEKITFPPKPERQTYGQTDGHLLYRVALLLKIDYISQNGNGTVTNKCSFYSNIIWLLIFD